MGTQHSLQGALLQQQPRPEWPETQVSMSQQAAHSCGWATGHYAAMASTDIPPHSDPLPRGGTRVAAGA